MESITEESEPDVGSCGAGGTYVSGTVFTSGTIVVAHSRELC